jgi:ATP-dependent protease ClpP protease subunit
MKWYSIRPQAVSAKADAPSAAEIYVYGDIGESWSDETVAARQFVKEISALDVDRITVRINSVGGSVPDGLAIYNALRRHRAHVTTAIDGMAMSIASLIAMAGDTIEMADNAILMIHAPWTFVAGNSAELRESADLLDKWAQAMATSYATKTGKSADEILALLTDGVDHYYTAEEAVAQGFADAMVEALPIAASAAIPATALARYPTAAARHPSITHPAATAANQQEQSMPQATENPVAQPQAADEKAIAAKALAAETDRRKAVRAEFAPLMARKIEGLDKLQEQCLDDASVTPEAACKQILALMAKDVEPVNPTHIETVEDEADKRRDGIVASMIVRAGLADKATRERAMHSAHRGAKLLDLARESCIRAGRRVDGLGQMEVVAHAFTSSTSDFPILLENAMHKVLQGAYAVAPNTWRSFCRVGSVSDFRDHKRYRTGSLGNLRQVNELGEYTTEAIPDGEVSAVAIDTKGYIVPLSRQMIINDDLGAFLGLSADMGRAAMRTIETDVYSLLLLNNGLGPTQADGQPLFHSTRGNVGTASILGVDGLDGDISLMGAQTDIGGNDFLDLEPSVLLVAKSLRGKAFEVVNAEFNDEATKNQRRPNSVRNQFDEIVGSPRLSGTRRYLFANPSIAPVIEVDFLDGNETPFMEMETAFTTDGARYKVRLDFGVNDVDFRGAVTNVGTTG